MPEGLGLFIKDKSVDLVLLRTEGGRLRLVNSNSSHIAPSLPGNKRAAISDLIKEVFNQVKPRTKNIAVSLSSNLTKLRYIEVTGAKPKRAGRLIEKEGSRLTSAKADDITDVYIYPSKQATKANISALFVAAEKEGFENCLGALRDLRIWPKIIEPLSLSALRILRASKQITQDKPALILYLETNRLINATVIKDVEILLSRNIHLGARSKKLIDDLIIQLDFLFDYFKSPPYKIKIPKIIFCGFTNPTEWIEALSKKFECQIEVENPASVITDLPDTCGWSAAIGAAMQTIQRDPIQINLMPSSRVKANKILFLTASLLLIAAILIFALYQTRSLHLMRPLRLPLFKQEKPTTEEPPESPAEATKPTIFKPIRFITPLRLEGIVWDGARCFAIINGETYNVGDKVRNYRIEAIDEKGVTLIKDAKTLKLFLYEDFEQEK